MVKRSQIRFLDVLSTSRSAKDSVYSITIIDVHSLYLRDYFDAPAR